MLFVGIEWKKVFSHTHPADLGDTGFFTDRADAMNKNANDEDADMFSILNQLEEYRTCNGSFHFRLCYPELAEQNFSFPCNEWTQFNNPALDSLSKDFEPINITFQSSTKNFTGLSCSDRGKEVSLMEDFPYIYNSRSFHIGSFKGVEGKIVGPPSYLVEKVELFINPGIITKHSGNQRFLCLIDFYRQEGTKHSEQ